MSDPKFDALERRATVRLVNYWLSLRRSDRGCFFQDFDPYRNPISWENCFLVRIEPPSIELEVEHIGGGTIAAFFGRLPAPVPVSASDIIAARFGDPRSAVADGQLLKREGSLQRPDGCVVLYRSVLLPFTGAKDAASYVLGALTHRIEAASADVTPSARASA